MDQQKLSETSVQTATLLHGTATALDSENAGVNDTYIGLIKTESSEIRAYVKVLSAKQLANELIVGSLGKALGLPMPDVYLVSIPAGALPTRNTSQLIAFGSAESEYPSMRRRMIDWGDSAAGKLLAAWKGMYETIMFDEWVANIDRNAGNLLIGGPDDILLIDHGHTLTGPNWTKPDLIPGIGVVNLLAAFYLAGIDDDKRFTLNKKSGDHMARFKTITVDHVMDNSLSEHFLTPEDFVAAKAFLVKRVESLCDLMSVRLGIPTLVFSHD